MLSARKPYPSDVSDEQWALVASYLTLSREDAGQRQHSLRELFNSLEVLFITGYAENAALGNGQLEAGMSVLTKQFLIVTMTERIRSMVESDHK